MNKVIVITGTSTGVGLHTSILLAKNGHTIYATMRNLDKAKELNRLAKENGVSINVVQLDVQKQQSVDDAFEHILSQEHRVDVLINNAGAGFIRTLEQASMDEISQVMDVNFYGPIRCIKAVMPTMRAQHSGHIINISSVGGLVGQPLNEIYCAAKFALEGLSESIATYMKPYFGINVSLIEPGGITTEFGNNVMNYVSQTGGIRKDAYTPLVEDYMAYRQTFTDEKKEKIFQTPGQVASIIAECIESPEPKLRYLTSIWAQEFTHFKTYDDLSGEKLQKYVRKSILDKD